MDCPRATGGSGFINCPLPTRVSLLCPGSMYMQVPAGRSKCWAPGGTVDVDLMGLLLRAGSRKKSHQDAEGCESDVK